MPHLTWTEAYLIACVICGLIGLAWLRLAPLVDDDGYPVEGEGDEQPHGDVIAIPKVEIPSFHSRGE